MCKRQLAVSHGTFTWFTWYSRSDDQLLPVREGAPCGMASEPNRHSVDSIDYSTYNRVYRMVVRCTCPSVVFRYASHRRPAPQTMCVNVGGHRLGGLAKPDRIRVRPFSVVVRIGDRSIDRSIDSVIGRSIDSMFARSSEHASEHRSTRPTDRSIDISNYCIDRPCVRCRSTGRSVDRPCVQFENYRCRPPTIGHHWKDMSLESASDFAHDLARRQMLMWCMRGAGAECTRRRLHRDMQPSDFDPPPEEVCGDRNSTNFLLFLDASHRRPTPQTMCVDVGGHRLSVFQSVASDSST